MTSNFDFQPSGAHWSGDTVHPSAQTVAGPVEHHANACGSTLATAPEMMTYIPKNMDRTSEEENYLTIVVGVVSQLMKLLNYHCYIHQ